MSFSVSGVGFGSRGISSMHAKVIQELLALGISPTYNYSADVAKLNAAKAKKGPKSTSGTNKVDTAKLQKATNKTARENIKIQPQTEKITSSKLQDDITGAMQIAELNKAFLVKKFNQ